MTYAWEEWFRKERDTLRINAVHGSSKYETETGCGTSVPPVIGTQPMTREYHSHLELSVPGVPEAEMTECWRFNSINSK